jgi:hypothetical protein
MCTGRIGTHGWPIRRSWRTATVISRRHLLYQILYGDPLDPRRLRGPRRTRHPAMPSGWAVVNVIGLQNMKPATGRPAVALHMSPLNRYDAVRRCTAWSGSR